MLSRIVDGISGSLKSRFGNGFTIYSDTLGQVPDTPSFYITVRKSSRSRRLGVRSYSENSFDIQYFSEIANSNSEILGVVDALYDILYQIELSDSSILRGSKMRHKTVNGVLHFFVYYNFYLTEQPMGTTKMAELEMKERVI
jgi:hypothetical protein